MMVFRNAAASDRSALTRLWQEGFGDPVAFIDLFMESGFTPERSLVAEVDGELAAMLYWFDCRLGSERYGYIYAVATDPRFQGQGIASRLMAETHGLLAQQGYAGAILSPGSESLFRFYGRMGYETCGWVAQRIHSAGAPLPLRQLCTEEYASLRAQMLPDNGMAQEGANLAYLSRFAKFYAGEDFLAAVAGSSVAEFLGKGAKIPGLLGALGLETAQVRRPGSDRPLVMGLRFDRIKFPSVYFGFPFD